MGRQQYIARLALGRSAYEPPEPEDDPESLRRLEAALARSSESHSAGPEQYVQQFDSSGHPINPASRTAARDMIRAQNDVLATVGVCYGIAAGDKSSAHNRAKSERGRLESVMRENEVGLFIGAADLGVLFLANWWLDGIRHRVQVFKTFSDVSFSEMFWIQQKHYGLRTMLFAGMPAHIAFTSLNATRDFIQARLINYLYFSNSLNPDLERRKHNRKLIGYLDKLLSFLSFIFLSPLMMYSNLQTLGLLPPYPLLPNLQSFVPLSATSPLQLPAVSGGITPRILLGLVWSSVTSPIILLYAFSHIRDFIDYQSFILIRDWVTKPDYPDPWSIKGAIEDELDKDTIPGLGGPHLIGVGPELDISSSVAWPVGGLRDARDWLMGVLRVGGEEPIGRVPTASGSATSDRSAVTHATNMAAVRRRSANTDEGLGMVEEATNTLSAFQAVTTDSPSPPILRPGVMGSDLPPILVRFGPSGHAGSALEREGSSRSSETSRDEHVLAEEATSSRNEVEADGIELDVLDAQPLFASDISASPLGDLGGSHFNPHFSEIARAWDQDDEHDSPSYNTGRRRRARGQKHRVTTLSSHPADVIASHMSSYLATWMTLPLETVLQRKMAMSFLAAASTPTARENAAFLLPEIYPPLVGLGLSRSMFRRGLRGVQAGTMTSRGFISGVGYASQLVITNLIQLLVSWTLFQVGYSGVTWVGKKWFRWGKL